MTQISGHYQKESSLDCCLSVLTKVSLTVNGLWR